MITKKTREKTKLKTNNKVKTYEQVQEFTEEQLMIITQYRVDFLRKIYPFLDDEVEYNECCMEVRPLWKGPKKNKDDEEKRTFIMSYNAWHMTERDIEKLFEFGKMVNGKTYCLQYSLYAFDYHQKVVNETKSCVGKTVYRKQYEVNKKNARFTTVLGADFDHITIEEYNRTFKKLFMNAGLETIDIFTGHGVQAIVLLDGKCYDTEILRKFTQVLQQKGFANDSCIVDCARIFRLPYSFNCKEFEAFYKGKTDTARAINVFVFGDTDKRYSPADVFRALNTLPDVIPPSKEVENMEKVIEELELTSTKPFVTERKQKIEKELAKIELKDIEGEYPIDFARLPTAVQKVLQGAPEGLRNHVLYFLIPFFKNAMKISLEHAIEIMKIWDKHCVPSEGEAHIENEVTRIWHTYFDKKYGNYKPLEEYYGKITFDEYKLDNIILIPNIFFKHLKGISDGAVQIYISLLLENKLDDKTEWTAEEIMKCANISKMTFYRNIDMLIVCGFLDKNRSYKRGKEDYSYRINAYKYYAGDNGYTKIEVQTVENLLRKLNKGELPLYLFLRYMITSTNNIKCYASQEWIGEMMGKSRTTITNSTKALHEKRCIKKITTQNGIISHTIYTLF